MAIAGLVPNHESQFSQAALNMGFKRERLSENVETYALPIYSMVRLT
jgi:hypothetical protein